MADREEKVGREEEDAMERRAEEGGGSTALTLRENIVACLGV